jgi:hypothetical protein
MNETREVVTKTLPGPNELIVLCDVRFMGPPGDNPTESILRVCAQQWAFEQQESELRLLRGKRAEADRDALRERLEKAERVCRNALSRRWDLVGEVMGRYDDEMDMALDEWQALVSLPPEESET